MNWGINWDMTWAILSSLGGFAIIYGAIDSRRQMKERNRAIEASWHAHKKDE